MAIGSGWAGASGDSVAMNGRGGLKTGLEMRYEEKEIPDVSYFWGL